MMSDFDRGYKQGIEDGHRCERRHADIDKLEQENAKLKARVEVLEEESRQWEKANLVELIKERDQLRLAKLKELET
jgi:cell division protein FtsB